MEKFPYTPNPHTYPIKKYGTKFVPILGSFILGALLIYFLFPREKTVEKIVDRPIDRIVEKPVDRIVEKPVEKIVEKTVEVPAKLTTEQVQAIFVYLKILETSKHQIGMFDKAIYPAGENKVKISVVGGDSVFQKISKSEIESRVESVFRRNGFKIVYSDIENPNTIIFVDADLMLSDNGITLSGLVRLQIFQLIMGFSGGIWKQTLVCTNQYDQNISYGSNHFYKIPSLFESLAIKASNDLSKAGETPLLSQ
jgi:hypothetical protein